MFNKRQVPGVLLKLKIRPNYHFQLQRVIVWYIKSSAWKQIQQLYKKRFHAQEELKASKNMPQLQITQSSVQKDQQIPSLMHSKLHLINFSARLNRQSTFKYPHKQNIRATKEVPECNKYSVHSRQQNLYCTQLRKPATGQWITFPY